MTYRRCGASGINLPLISIGLWQNFGSHAPFHKVKEMAHYAFDQGVCHFDLANNYGPEYGTAEENFGRLMETSFQPYRDELFISSKAGYDMWPGPYGEWGSRKYLMASLNQSLKRMHLDYVDIFYTHRFDPITPVEETMQALVDIVRQGKALYVGISRYPHEAALTEEHLGHREVADTLLPLALRHVASSIDSVTFFNAIHEIHALRGEFRKAYEALSVATEIQGRVVSTVLSRSLTHAMQAYFEEQYKLEKSRRQTACILIFLVLVDLASVILLTTSTLRQSRQKIIAEMERADSLSRDLQHITLLRQGADAALSTLVEDKIKTMQGLADTYLSWSDRAVNLRDEQKGNALREDIISSFRSELRSLRSDEHLIPSIESALNTSGNRLMSRLRSDFSGFSGEPRLKEMDYQLLSLFFAGFSTKSIGFMLDMSDEAVRTRKYRYRKLFSSLPGPNMQEYYRRLSK